MIMRNLRVEEVMNDVTIGYVMRKLQTLTQTMFAAVRQVETRKSAYMIDAKTIFSIDSLRLSAHI